MITEKNITLRRVVRFSGHHFVWITPWSALPVLIFEFTDFHWLAVPWLPISLIGTALAFYLGFKNNSSYDRLWEARKIWGSIINSSRSWGSSVKGFVTDQYAKNPVSDQELYGIKKRLIHRHIAWIYALRSQLLEVAPWEHASQGGLVGIFGRKNRSQKGIGLVNEHESGTELVNFLPKKESEELARYKNTATQIIDRQSEDLKELSNKGLIDTYRHVELQAILREFYDHQGKCERIKKFPFPRQYGNMSIVFVGLFIFLLPLGMVSEFAKLGDWGVWFSIPFTMIVSWVYVVMELVGDYSENPFEGLPNDIPMLSLCRTIEINLKEMLGETDIPSAIDAKNGVLM